MLNIITPSRLSGAERVVGLLTKWENENGHHPRILMKPNQPVSEWYTSLGLDLSIANISGKANIFAMSKILKEIRSHKAEIIHTHLSTASLWGSIAANFAKIPSVAHVHALNSKTTFQFATKLIAVSDAVKKHLIKQGVPESKIEVVRPVAPILGSELPNPAKDIQNLKGPVIIQIGHLSEKKGQRITLSAANLVWQKFPDAQFVFVGEGPDLEVLKQLSKGDSRVHFLGFRTDVLAILLPSKIAILPSLGMEGMPAVIQEAQYAKKPVIASKVGGVIEQISDDHNGFLIEPGNPNELANKIIQLLSSNELYQTMSESAFKWAKTLSFDQSCQDTIQVLEKTLIEYRNR